MDNKATIEEQDVVYLDEDDEDEVETAGSNAMDLPPPVSSMTNTNPADKLKFYVLVGDDGSITIDRSTINRDNEIDGQSFLSVVLPKAEVKDINNPLPGHPIGSSRRKTKPLVRNEDDFGNILTASTSAAVTSMLHSQPLTIDASAFNEWEPQQLETLETVLKSAQAREILENLDLESNVVAEIPIDLEEDGSQPLWDHSYSASNTPTKGDVEPTIIHPQQSLLDTSKPQTTISIAPTLTNVSRARTDQIRKKSLFVSQINPLVLTPSQSSNLEDENKPSPSSVIVTTPSSSRKISEGDANNSNIRRSQRQQDRIEKQEADRIREENQQMLQREKQIMKEGGSPLTLTPKSDIAQSPNPNAIMISPTLTQLTPISIAAPPLNLDPEQKARISLAVNKLVEESKIIYTTGTPDLKRPSTIKEQRQQSLSNSASKYPKRERKLPAHLIDPNFVSTEEEAKILLKDAIEIKEVEVEHMDVDVDEVDSSTNKLADTDYIEEDSEYNAEDKEDVDVDVDDPNRLWCVCQKPHNNRFMIACDKCENWFHGKCVGVTKAQGAALEIWHCSECKKKMREEKIKEQQKKREEVSINRRVSTELKTKGKKGQPGSQKKVILTPTKSKNQRRLSEKTSPSSSLPAGGGIKKSTSKDDTLCVVCNKAARPDSAYCSDECVLKYAKGTGLMKQQQGADTTPLQNDPKKLKRTNSQKSPDEVPESFLTFHVITSGSSKSTEVVPQKQKELTASALLLKQQKQGVSKKPSKPLLSPSTPTPPTTKSSQLVKKKLSVGERETKTEVKKIKSGSGSGDQKDENEKHKIKEDGKSEKRERRHSHSEKKERREIPSKPTESEGLLRENIRKAIRETLKNRLKEMPENDKKKIPEGNTAEVLSVKIEKELISYFGTASNPKCKSKYRSIYFNLKDPKNSLYIEILHGRIEAKKLVKMDPQEMASQELAQWREKENKKELEMIKKAELDKLAEAKKQALIDAGAEIDKVDEDHRKAIIMPEDIKEKEGKLEGEKSKGDGEGKSDKEKSEKSKRNKDKHRTSSRDRRKSSRHSDRRDKSKHKKEKRSSKDKEKSSESKKKEEKKITEDKKQIEKSDSLKGTSPAAEESPLTSVSGEDSLSHDSLSVKPSTSNVKHEVRQSTDSEQEQPSSTIKTPDYTDALIKENQQKSLFSCRLSMHELGHFNASVYHCSHTHLEGTLFPESPVQIVGRISPDTVWDYIDKMKKTKEVIVFRLAPDTEADTESYMTFFTYLSSRGRLGVLGGAISPLKDVYLIPLDKHSPVNRALLPFRGPGLPKDRTHCLLACVTRHQPEIPTGPTPIISKRKASISNNETSIKKRPKLGVDIKPGAITQLCTSTEGEKVDDKNDDDDEPYTPWEDEDTKDEVEAIEKIEDVIPTTKISTLLSELEEKIEREKKEIATLSLETVSRIPGLDSIPGIFDSETNENATSKNVPFFLRMPSSSNNSKTEEIETENDKKTESKSKDKVDSSVEIINLEESKDDKDKESSLDKEALPIIDEEAPYSPSSGIDFSDDQDSTKLLTKDEDERIKPDLVTLSPTEDDDEPLPPGIEIKKNDDKIEVKNQKDLASTKQIIEEKKLSPPLLKKKEVDTVPFINLPPAFVDLTDDLEVPSTSTRDSSQAQRPKTNSIYDLFPGMKPPIVSPATTSSQPSKLKININLDINKPENKAAAVSSSPIVPSLPKISFTKKGLNQGTSAISSITPLPPQIPVIPPPPAPSISQNISSVVAAAQIPPLPSTPRILPSSHPQSKIQQQPPVQVVPKLPIGVNTSIPPPPILNPITTIGQIPVNTTLPPPPSPMLASSVPPTSATQIIPGQNIFQSSSLSSRLPLPILRGMPPRFPPTVPPPPPSVPTNNSGTPFVGAINIRAPPPLISPVRPTIFPNPAAEWQGGEREDRGNLIEKKDLSPEQRGGGREMMMHQSSVGGRNGGLDRFENRSRRRIFPPRGGREFARRSSRSKSRSRSRERRRRRYSRSRSPRYHRRGNRKSRSRSRSPNKSSRRRRSRSRSYERRRKLRGKSSSRSKSRSKSKSPKRTRHHSHSQLSRSRSNSKSPSLINTEIEKPEKEKDETAIIVENTEIINN